MKTEKEITEQIKYELNEYNSRKLTYIEVVYNLKEFCKELQNEVLEEQQSIINSSYFSEHDIDLSYLCGVFNVSGIDGLYNEIQRLKQINKKPRDIFKHLKSKPF